MIAGYLVPTLSIFFLSIFSNSKTGVIGYSMTALVASLTYSFFYGVHYFITKGYDNPSIDYKVNKKSISIKDIIKTVLTNTQLIAVMVYDLFKLIPFYMIAASIAYYCKIVLNDTESVASLLVSFNLGTFIGCMLSNKSVKLVGSKNTNFLGIIGFIICHFVAYLLPTSKMTIMFLLGLGQIFFGIAHGNTTNLYSMCSTYSEYENNKSIKGMAMALCNTSIKVCIVIRGMIITGVLSLINYNPDVARTYEVVNGIKTLFFLIPIGFLILSLIPLIWFKIKDSDIEYMEKIISYNKNN